MNWIYTQLLNISAEKQRFGCNYEWCLKKQCSQDKYKLSATLLVDFYNSQKLNDTWTAIWKELNQSKHWLYDRKPVSCDVCVCVHFFVVNEVKYDKQTAQRSFKSALLSHL